jgi:DNA-binding response OmpR family regulator
VHLLVVEDDDAIAEPLAEGLERVGFDVTRVATGEAALLLGRAARPSAAERIDLVLLDLGLPDLDGLEVCRQLREASSVPIIVITSRGDESDRVLGLELGADDYLVKPFGFRELVARIRAVSRRLPVAHRGDGTEAGLDAFDPDVPQQLGRLTLDRRAHRVTVDTDEVALSPKEFDLLALLAENPGAVVLRGIILEEVWDPHWYGPTKTLDVHVASLRRKLGHPEWIETVRGVGLRLGPTE